jgi:hypothetical protein
MKSGRVFLSCICLGAMLSGCGESLREEEYRVRVETLVDEANMKVYRLHLTFSGAKGVRTTQSDDHGGGGKTTVWYRTEEPAQVQTADVTLSAVQIPVKSENTLSQHARISVQIGRSGGPLVRGLQQGESVKDGVELSVKDGVYRVGEPLAVGRILNERIELLVAPADELDAAEQTQVATHEARPTLSQELDSADVQNNDHRE